MSAAGITEPSYIHSKWPILIQNKINTWKILNYQEDDWCELFQTKLLRFRQGDKCFRQVPYWEQECEAKDMTLKTFFELSNEKQDTWLYFDYKYMKDVFPENSKLFNDITWSDLGLHTLSGKDSTLWIGNEGAHTPCHMDTYGCNLIAQIFGRKLWILMPPEETENLNPIRVPYEESSIYSSYNFYTPNYNLLKVRQAYKIVLSPGDVLFVPRHWWHYVENLRSAISINIWVPLEEDHESRLEESLVRHYISNICQDLTEEEAKQLLNPNEYKLMEESCSLHLTQKCIQNVKKFRQERQTESQESTNKINQSFIQDNQINLESYIEDKSKSLNYNPSVSVAPSDEVGSVALAKGLINSYCHPKNVVAIKDTLLSQFIMLDDDVSYVM